MVRLYSPHSKTYLDREDAFPFTRSFFHSFTLWPTLAHVHMKGDVSARRMICFPRFVDMICLTCEKHLLVNLLAFRKGTMVR
jgi:hypothetical protein